MSTSITKADVMLKDVDNAGYARVFEILRDINTRNRNLARQAGIPERLPRNVWINAFCTVHMGAGGWIHSPYFVETSVEPLSDRVTFLIETVQADDAVVVTDADEREALIARCEGRLTADRIYTYREAVLDLDRFPPDRPHRCFVYVDPSLPNVPVNVARWLAYALNDDPLIVILG